MFEGKSQPPKKNTLTSNFIIFLGDLFNDYSDSSPGFQHAFWINHTSHPPTSTPPSSQATAFPKEFCRGPFQGQPKNPWGIFFSDGKMFFFVAPKSSPSGIRCFRSRKATPKKGGFFPSLKNGVPGPIFFTMNHTFLEYSKMFKKKQ